MGSVGASPMRRFDLAVTIADGAAADRSSSAGSDALTDIGSPRSFNGFLAVMIAGFSPLADACAGFRSSLILVANSCAAGAQH